MPLEPGTALGPYEILAPLGAGGMGEVYRARDTRLGREVAVKVLPEVFQSDPERLRRFEQEARATSLLNHPNILSIYDIGTTDGVNFLVAELLNGETLREKLSNGALPARKALDYALQTTRGLAAAHEKGIVHRDLKPENVFLTKDGRVKILDFGLAKLSVFEAHPGASSVPTRQLETKTGVILGTAAYMSPEQVLGRPPDRRSDIFSFGAILYEMFTGHRPFHGSSTVEIMNAILKEEPRDISEFKPDLSPALERVVRRCLEKNADQRFQTASDLGFALEELSGLSGTSTRRVRAAEIKAVRYRAFTPWLLLIPLMLLAFWLGTRINKKPAIEPSFERLTFRRGNVLHAHFAPDGKTVVYGASWEGRPTEIFLASPGIPESRPFGLQKADVLSVSKQGEMAILLRTGMLQALAGTGTLARVSMTGGVSPREVIDKVFDADWLPDGNDLVVIRQINRKSVLEFPIGNPIFESEKVLVGCRVSPDGQSVVFLELDAGKNSMRLLDRQGKEKLLIEAENIDIASWSPDGNKLWFTAVINARPGIYSMDTNGRLLNSFPITASMVVQDISPDGTILLEQELFQQGVRVKLQNQSEEHDLSWLDGSGVSDITPDGQYLLINETGHAGGTNYAFYLRKTDGSPAIKLGDGLGTAISADGKMVISRQTGGKLILVPTGAGSTQRISPQGWNCLGGAWMHGSLDEIVMLCSQPRRKMRLYRFNLRTRQAPTAISPEGDFGNGVFYSEGKYLLGRINGQIHVLPEKHPPFSFLPFITAEDREFLAWNKEGLFVRNSEEFPAKIYKIDASTGQRSLWKEISPADPTIIRIDNVILTPDTRNFAYTYARVLASDLYLFRGLQ